MAYISIDIDLQDISTRDLIDELEDRYLNDQDHKCLLEMVKASDGGKLDLFLNVKERFTLLELEEMFKEKSFASTIPKEQLSLPL